MAAVLNSSDLLVMVTHTNTQTRKRRSNKNEFTGKTEMTNVKTMDEQMAMERIKSKEKTWKILNVVWLNLNYEPSLNSSILTSVTVLNNFLKQSKMPRWFKCFLEI